MKSTAPYGTRVLWRSGEKSRNDLPYVLFFWGRIPDWWRSRSFAVAQLGRFLKRRSKYLYTR